ncbi:MAG: type I glyceraldehyde-3-phosphate dehydrogenase [Candidatus Krumholzibacteriia bacterium]
MKVAINGFGRIGRTVFRLMLERDDVEVVGLNDLYDPEVLAYMLRRDSVMGNFRGRAQVEGDQLMTDQGPVKMMAVKSPAELPWGDLGVDVVIEASGVFRKRDQIEQHLAAGAKKVLLTVPAKDPIDAMIVLGVNDEMLKPGHKLVSNASCTTNCLAPLAYVLDREFGIEYGLMTTCHAYTNDQRLVDSPHKDWRRARAAAINIIPTTTGAARAVGKVLPHLEGRLDGTSLRVPVACGSIVDLVSMMKREVTVDEVNAAMKKASESDQLRDILAYAEDPLVSSDIVGDPHSSIFDPGTTAVLHGRMLKTMAWYDNEWGYSNRVLDLAVRMHEIGYE